MSLHILSVDPLLCNRSIYFNGSFNTTHSFVHSCLAGIIHEDLRLFLESNVPKSSKKQKSMLGVGDQKIAQAITEELSIPCMHTSAVPEIIRGNSNFYVILFICLFKVCFKYCSNISLSLISGCLTSVVYLFKSRKQH